MVRSYMYVFVLHTNSYYSIIHAFQCTFWRLNEFLLARANIIFPVTSRKTHSAYRLPFEIQYAWDLQQAKLNFFAGDLPQHQDQLKHNCKVRFSLNYPLHSAHCKYLVNPEKQRIVIKISNAILFTTNVDGKYILYKAKYSIVTI